MRFLSGGHTLRSPKQRLGWGGVGVGWSGRFRQFGATRIAYGWHDCLKPADGVGGPNASHDVLALPTARPPPAPDLRCQPRKPHNTSGKYQPLYIDSWIGALQAATNSLPHPPFPPPVPTLARLGTVQAEVIGRLGTWASMRYSP
jgi:hypothetical protein